MPKIIKRSSAYSTPEEYSPLSFLSKPELVRFLCTPYPYVESPCYMARGCYRTHAVIGHDMQCQKRGYRKLHREVYK